MSRILVTGMSGTGKSSALAELGRRGYVEHAAAAREMWEQAAAVS